jgi:hypothetical protein
MSFAFQTHALVTLYRRFSSSADSG